MFCFSHRSLILLSGLVWFLVGSFLLTLGIQFLMQAIAIEKTPLLNVLSIWTGGRQEAVIVLVVIALLAGRLKAKKVLAKAAQKGILRLRSFSSPVPLSWLYSKSYLFLLIGMMGLGMLMNIFNFPKDIRGFIDLTIGAALLTGSLCYFRACLENPSC